MSDKSVVNKYLLSLQLSLIYCELYKPSDLVVLAETDLIVC